MSKTYKEKYLKTHPGVNFEKDVLSIFCPGDVGNLSIPESVARQFCRIFHEDCAACWNQRNWKDTLKSGGSQNVYNFPGVNGDSKPR